MNGTNLQLKENSFSTGNKALQIYNRVATLACNQFIYWDTGIYLSGFNQISMCPNGGGGYNVFTNNRFHIKMNHATLPDILDGGNSFGNHGTNCLEGSVIECPSNFWNASGNYFLPTSLENSFGSNVQSSNLVNTYTMETITVGAMNVLTTSQICPDNPTENNSDGKSNSSDILYDVTGREIPQDALEQPYIPQFLIQR